MNMQTDLQIKLELEKNIFDSNLFDIELINDDYHWDFKSALKSADLPNYKFNNYFGSKAEYFKFVKREYYKFIQKQFEGAEGIFDEYTLRDFGGADRRKVIKKIIVKNTKKYPQNLPIVKRLVHNENKNFQIYFYEAGKSAYRIVAIDLYHLILPANDQFRKDVRNDGIKRYEENKYNKHCLSEILK